MSETQKKKRSGTKDRKKQDPQRVEQRINKFLKRYAAWYHCVHSKVLNSRRCNRPRAWAQVLRKSRRAMELSLSIWKYTQLPAEARREKPLILAKQNAHWRDSLIFFTEHDHKYHTPLKMLLQKAGQIFSELSGSKVISLVSEPFEEDKVINENRKNWGPGHYGYGKSNQWIKNYWKEGREKGTAFHLNAELFLNSEIKKTVIAPDNVVPFQYWRDWHKKVVRKLEFFRTEWRIWNLIRVEDRWLILYGSVDAVCVDRRGSTDPKKWAYTIFDWKRSKAPLYYNKKRCYEPIEDLFHNKITEYGFQISGVYRGILQGPYKLKTVVQCAAIRCHPESREPEAEVIPLQDMREYVQRVIVYHLTKQDPICDAVVEHE